MEKLSYENFRDTILLALEKTELPDHLAFDAIKSLLSGTTYEETLARQVAALHLMITIAYRNEITPEDAARVIVEGYHRSQARIISEEKETH